MDFVNPLLIAVATLSSAVAFLFGLLWKLATERITELKNDLKAERIKNEKLRESMGNDMGQLIASNMEVVKSNTSVLEKILKDG